MPSVEEARQASLGVRLQDQGVSRQAHAEPLELIGCGASLMREGYGTAGATHEGAAVELGAEALRHVLILLVERQLETLQEAIDQRRQGRAAWKRRGHPDRLVHGRHHGLAHRACERILVRFLGVAVAAHGRLVHDQQCAVRVELPQQPSAAAHVAHEVHARVVLKVVQVAQAFFLCQALLLALEVHLADRVLQAFHRRHGGHGIRRRQVYVVPQAAAARVTRRDAATLDECAREAERVGDAAHAQHHGQRRAAEDERVRREEVQQVRHHRGLACTRRRDAED
mmetsp:Transcript_67620/g.174198  ORF Transcript_67620/g.174198 Transcript_67620/m.174198 type:complete len:283 (+) Transcript_67620:1233-2081(+)